MGIPLAGCIDATTVYTVPDMPPPSGDDGGATADDGGPGDGSLEVGDEAGETGDAVSDAPAPEGGAGD